MCHFQHDTLQIFLFSPPPFHRRSWFQQLAAPPNGALLTSATLQRWHGQPAKMAAEEPGETLQPDAKPTVQLLHDQQSEAAATRVPTATGRKEIVVAKTDSPEQMSEAPEIHLSGIEASVTCLLLQKQTGKTDAETLAELQQKHTLHRKSRQVRKASQWQPFGKGRGGGLMPPPLPLYFCWHWT